MRLADPSPGFRSCPTRRRTRCRPCAALALLLAAACGGGGGGTTSPPPGGNTGGFTIAVSAPSLSFAPGGNGTVTITLTRTGSFTGAVSLSTSALANGVSASFAPAQLTTGQTTSTLTLIAVASASAGTTTLTIRATAAGHTDQTVTVQVTITPPAQAGPFSLAISATSHLVYPSNQLAWNPLLTITRHAGFTGPVAFSYSGLPPTLFLAFSSSPAVGNTTQVVVLNAGGTPNGTYTATIKGTAAGLGEQTITLQLVVAPPSTGSIKWKWCSSSGPRYFVALRDGNGPWTRLMPANDTSYSFNITQGAGALAEVTIDSGGFRTTVYHYTAQEMAARASAQCALYPNVSTRTANGSFAGVTGFRTSQAGMGWWFGSANGNGNFTLLNLPAGPLDVFAARNGELLVPHAIPVDRLIVRRAQNPASGATMPALDFNAAESFAPTTSTWTFGNTGGESFGVSQSFITSGGSSGGFTALPTVDGPPAVRTVYGVPLAQTVAGDLHQVVATIATVGPVPGGPTRATRQIITYARTIADRALSFGPVMPAPNVTVAGPGRLRAQGTLPPEYTSGVSFDITQTTTARFATVQATRGALGAGAAYDVQLPDLSGAIGWDTQFAIRAGVPTNWWVSGGGPTLDWFDVRNIFNSTRSRWTGALTGVTPPADGATYWLARALGNTTP